MDMLLMAQQNMDFLSVVLRLVLAVVCGGIIGLERGFKGRAAGFRTYIIVCLGAVLTMLLGQYLAHTVVTGSVNTDVSRFGAQVINGVGFLGAGTILVTGSQEVKGLTTAAGLWASACMGLAIGAGFYICVAAGMVLILLCVMVMPYLEDFITANTRNVNLYIEFTTLDALGDVLGCIKAQNVAVFDVEIDRGKKARALNPSAIVYLRLKERRNKAKLISAISKIEGALSIRVI